MAEQADDLPMWHAVVLTLYPDMFPGPLGFALSGRALQNGFWDLQTVDIREFARDKHRSVDAPPAGGGPGMVMRTDVVAAAIDYGRRLINDVPVYCLSPRGKPFTQSIAHSMSEDKGAILLCGRFEGIDERVFQAREVEEISIGDYILSGGEVAAMAVIESVVRLLPGVVGSPKSLSEESFESGLLEYPQYTRPASWEGQDIPDVLISGNHQKVRQWRNEQSERLTRERRPDLWNKHRANRNKEAN